MIRNQVLKSNACHNTIVAKNLYVLIWKKQQLTEGFTVTSRYALFNCILFWSLNVRKSLFYFWLRVKAQLQYKSKEDKNNIRHDFKPKVRGHERVTKINKNCILIIWRWPKQNSPINNFRWLFKVFDFISLSKNVTE
jgi:hypothetical protein